MSDESVRPLVRGLAVLRELSAPDARNLRAGDLVHATGLARSTVDRVVGTLIRLGYVRQHGQELELAPRLMELGNAYLAASGLTRDITAHGARLADELEESVSLAVPDGDGVRFIAQATRRRAVSVSFRIGDLLPAERCAAGAVFAAGWGERQWRAWRAAAGDAARRTPAGLVSRTVPEEEFAGRAAAAREHGWAVDDQLVEPGLVAVAVPVHGPDGSVLCALSVVSHTNRHSAQGLAELMLPRLRREAARLAEVFARRCDGPGGGAGRVPDAAEVGPDCSAAEAARAAKGELGAEFLQSLARGLAVLRSLEGAYGGPYGGGLTIGEVAEVTGLARTTARRSLSTLEQEGYAAHAGGRFRLLPRVLELGHSRLSALGFADIAQPYLHDLVARVHESASVTVLEGHDILYVARVPTVRIMKVHIALGARFPAYATAMGRVLLAGLPEPERRRLLTLWPPQPLTRHTITSLAALEQILRRTASEGYAVTDQELEEGLRSVAVPLRDADGAVVAALNVALHAGESPVHEALERLLPALRETAAAIEADLSTAARFNTVGMP